MQVTRFSEADFDLALTLVRDCEQAPDLPEFRLRVLGISDLRSAEEWHATDLYREFFEPVGAEDQVAFGLPSSPRMVLGVSLNRPSRGFSAEERALLALLAPYLGNAYRVGWRRSGRPSRR